MLLLLVACLFNTQYEYDDGTKGSRAAEGGPRMGFGQTRAVRASNSSAAKGGWPFNATAVAAGVFTSQ